MSNIQDLANHLHHISGGGLEHLSIHSCPCLLEAESWAAKFTAYALSDSFESVSIYELEDDEHIHLLAPDETMKRFWTATAAREKAAFERGKYARSKDLEERGLVVVDKAEYEALLDERYRSQCDV